MRKVFFGAVILSVFTQMSCSRSNVTGPSKNGSSTESSIPMTLEFDGTSGEVIFPGSSILHPQHFTVQFRAWFDPTSQVLVPLLNATGENLWDAADGYSIVYEQLGFGFGVAEQSNLRFGMNDTASLPLDQWTNISCTYDGRYLSLYIDGELAKQVAYSDSVYYSDNGFTLGEALHTYYSSQPLWFRGGLDNLQIWNYALSKSEIDSTMNKELTGSESGLVGYWDFNQNSSYRVAIDRTGNEDNGILEGGVKFVPVDSI